MAEVYGLHEIELRPGVSPEAFEKLVSEVFQSAAPFEGWTMRLLKGERGERNGKYLVMMEIESLAARDRYAPNPEGPYSQEADELSQQNAAFWERWRAMATLPGEDTVFTDYVVRVWQ